VRTSGAKHALRVVKTLSALGESTVRVAYEIRNEGFTRCEAAFGVELNLSIGEPSVGSGCFEPSVRERSFRDSWRALEIRLRSEPEASMIAVPLETVSESEGGLEGTYQQLAVLFQRKLVIAPGQAKEHLFELDVR
jgi:hypothetical protein